MLYTESEFDNIVRNAVLKPEGHFEQKSNEGPQGTKLYTITTFASAPVYGGERTPAVCLSFDRAKEIVETNEGDIFELSYELVVVEVILADCCYGSGYFLERYWWAWYDITDADNRNGKYYPIEEPERFNGIVGFGIG